MYYERSLNTEKDQRFIVTRSLQFRMSLSLVPPPFPPNSLYAGHYCEENIYHLAASFLRQPSIKDAWDITVVFMSNESKAVRLHFASQSGLCQLIPHADCALESEFGRLGWSCYCVGLSCRVDLAPKIGPSCWGFHCSRKRHPGMDLRLWYPSAKAMPVERRVAYVWYFVSNLKNETCFVRRLRLDDLPHWRSSSTAVPKVSLSQYHTAEVEVPYFHFIVFSEWFRRTSFSIILPVIVHICLRLWIRRHTNLILPIIGPHHPGL